MGVKRAYESESELTLPDGGTDTDLFMESCRVIDPCERRFDDELCIFSGARYALPCC